jgi:CheY-like chemotaxis protein
MHVLVVDDEKDLQLLFRQRFRREIRAQEVTLHFALSGEEALAYLTQHNPMDIVLILSDINMPGMSGLELLQRLKERFTHVKVFMITAYDDADNYQMAMQHGADDYITKPIDFNGLKQKMQAL